MRRPTKGFTIIEMVVTLVVLGIIASAGAVAITNGVGPFVSLLLAFAAGFLAAAGAVLARKRSSWRPDRGDRWAGTASS